MEVFEQGRTAPISLGTKEYIASGGEGSVYARGSTAYKVYTDPTKMIPVAKIKELSIITSPRVIRPLKVLLDKKDKPVGYTMQYLTNTVSLCQTFTKAYRDRVHITPDMVLNLVRDFQATVNHIHAAGILIVDLNEMNFLVDSKHKEVLFIDVDSYQTKNFPATAIMESIRDRHSPNFTQNTDWFSFAVVSFQMFIGIHPYKGKHDTLSGFDERMLANVSVLNKAVSIPKICYPFSAIPQSYMDWYKAVLEQGKRLPPPNDLQATITVVPVITRVKGSKNFDLTEIYVVGESIVQHLSQDGIHATLTTKSVYKNGKKIYDVSGTTYLCVTKKSAHILAATIKVGDSGSNVALYDTTAGVAVEFEYNAEAMMSYNGRLYFKQSGSIFEVEFIDGKKLIAMATAVATVHEMNTKLFDGVAVQTMFGRYFVTVFPESKTSYELPIKEIDGQVINAKFDNGVLMVVTAKKGKYTRYVIRFSSDYSTYDIRTVADITYTGLNFTTLDNGICCHMTEDEEVHLSRNKKDDAMTKIVIDDHVKGDAKLFRDGTTVLIAQGDTLSSMTMKKAP